MIGVLEEIEARGAVQPMRRRAIRLARAVISLPRLIESEIGVHTHAGAADMSDET